MLRSSNFISSRVLHSRRDLPGWTRKLSPILNVRKKISIIKHLKSLWPIFTWDRVNLVEIHRYDGDADLGNFVIFISWKRHWMRSLHHIYSIWFLTWIEFKKSGITIIFLQFIQDTIISRIHCFLAVYLNGAILFAN